MTPALVLRDVAVGYHRPLISGIDLQVDTGQVHCIMGPNGCGKSTLLRTIAGTLAPLTGSISVSGLEVQDWAAWRRAAVGGIAYVPQSGKNFRGLSVRENLELAFWNRPEGRKSRTQAIRSVLDRELFSPLAGRLHEPAARLSGGEDLLLAVARILLRQPAVVLFDEPSAGLFVRYRALVAEVIREVGTQSAVVVVEQLKSVVDALGGPRYAVRTGDLGDAHWLQPLQTRGP